MIVFKTYTKVLKACFASIIMYTVILIAFGGLNMKTSDTSTNFVSSKPDVLIINNDEEKGITKSLIKYFEKNSNIKDIQKSEDKINDALFYRDVNYVIYIPENFREDILNNKKPEIKIKSTEDYNASLAEILLNRYLEVLNIYNDEIDSEKELIEKIEETLSKNTKVEITSKVDNESLSKVAVYYNFANYSLLAGCVYVICLILSSFKDEKIRKRTTISSMDYKKYNRYLLLSNSIFAIVLWLFYVLLSFILLGKIMFTINGLIYILNSLVFTICALSIAFLIGNVVTNKNAISGLINVIALGSSFLCGAFVPMSMLPDIVLKIAHVLPSYYYIKNNEILTNLEITNIEVLKPIFINMLIVLIFTIIFIIITNIVSKNKRTIKD